jgi:hypothetical protein
MTKKKKVVILISVIIMLLIALIPVNCFMSRSQSIKIRNGYEVLGPFVILNRDMFLDGGSVIYLVSDKFGKTHCFSLEYDVGKYHKLLYHSPLANGTYDKGILVNEQVHAKNEIYHSRSVSRITVIDWLNDLKLTTGVFMFLINAAQQDDAPEPASPAR